MARFSRVLVFGTFDRLHPGHVSFLRQAKRRGAELIVAVARDPNVRRIKGRRPHQTEQRRAAALRRTGLASRVVLAAKHFADRYAFIKRLKPDLLCLGYDQATHSRNLKADLQAHGIDCRIVRLRPYRPHRFKSSLLRPRP